MNSNAQLPFRCKSFGILIPTMYSSTKGNPNDYGAEYLEKYCKNVFLYLKRILTKQSLKVKNIIKTTILSLTILTAQINELLRRAEFATEADIPGIRFEEMHLEISIILGLFVGSLFSVIIYRNKISKNTKIK